LIPPASRADLPIISVQRGSALRLHLGFRPRELWIAIQNGGKTSQTKLAPAQVAQFTPSRGGLMTVFARSAAGGEAGYVARLRVT
jgi:hypothetical protein